MDKSPDLCDWEVLQNSDAEELGEMEQQLDSSCDAVFQSDYFSLDPHQKPPSSDDGSAVSDNPSWIEPASDAPFPLLPPRDSADFWSDSGSDRSVSRRLIEGGDGLESSEKTNLVKYWSDSGGAFNLDYKNESPLEELGAQVESKLGFDCCGVGIGSIQHPVEHEKDESTHAEDDVDVDAGDGASDPSGDLATEEMKAGEKKEESDDKAVWWKLPLDLLKYCAFRVSPVWSLSVAAAFVGFVILGRRLYKMKRKTQGLHLKVIIDDKRVSQFMSHAARLNEAFSLVRRVPIIRPSLPSPGAAPWPVMTMR